MRHIITFEDDGTASAIYSDLLAPYLRDLGHVQTTRASDVEPEGDGWGVQIRAWVPGGARRIGPFATREAALVAEVAYLRAVL